MKPCERRQLIYVKAPDKYMGYWLFLVPAVFQLKLNFNLQPATCKTYLPCSHLLYKHKENDIRKRNKLQNEAVGVCDEARFPNGRRRNSPAAFAALQMPDTFLPTAFLSRLRLFLRPFFLFVINLEKIWAGICRRGRDNSANCLGKFLVENSILIRHFGQY